MSDTDWIADLARLAEAATPGPWTYLSRNAIDTPPIDVDEADWGPEGHEGLRIHTAQDTRAYRYADAKFIAAANPATILRLIAELQQQRHRTAEFQTIAAGFANRAVAAGDRLAAVGVLSWELSPADGPRVRAALAAPTDTTKEN